MSSIKDLCEVGGYDVTFWFIAAWRASVEMKDEIEKALTCHRKPIDLHFMDHFNSSIQGNL